MEIDLLAIYNYITENFLAIITIIVPFLALLATLYGWKLIDVAKILKCPKSREKLAEELENKSKLAGYQKNIKKLNIFLDGFFGKKLFSIRAFFVCLILAIFYPFLFFMLSWVFGASGDLQSLKIVSTEEDVWERLLLFTHIFLILLIPFLFIRDIYEFFELIEKIILRLLGKDKKDKINYVEKRKNPEIYAVVMLFAISSTLKYGPYISNDRTVYLNYGIVFFLAFFFAPLFYYVSIPSNHHLKKSSDLRRIRFYTISFSLLMLIIFASYLVLVKDTSQAMLILIFYIALPFINALFDFLSLCVSRWLLRRAENAKSIWLLLCEIVIDIIFALIFLAGLVFFIPLAIELINFVFSQYEQVDINIDVKKLLDDGLALPFYQALYIWGLLITTLIPTFLHLVYGFYGFFAVFTGSNAKVAKILSENKLNGIEIDWEIEIDRQKARDKIVNTGFLQNYIFAIIVTAVLIGLILGLCFLLLELIGFSLYDIAILAINIF